MKENADLEQTQPTLTNESRRHMLKQLAVGAATLPFTSVLHAEAADFSNQPITILPNENGPFDLVIENGRVLDPETHLDAIRHIGIKGNRIAAISTEPLQGTSIIDAQGLVVAPGFIDMHAHGQQLPAARAQAYDGVTTALEMESGLLPIGKFYDNVAQEGRPINYGASVAWTYARVTAKEQDMPPFDGTIAWFQKAFSKSNWQNSLATSQELDQILTLVEQGLKEGGLGIGVNAGYAPGYGHKEYYELAKLAKRYDVPTFTHVRYLNNSEPKSSFEAYQELISLAATTGAHMHICHLNSTSVGDIEDCADLIQSSIDRGIHVTTEAYPYGAGSSVVGAEVFRGDDWLERWGVPSASYMEMNGKTLTQDKITDLQNSAPGSIVVMHFLKPDENPDDRNKMDRSVLFPGAAIASDAMPWADDQGKVIEGHVWPLPDNAFAHPRSTGCFARFVSKYVNDYQAISLIEAMEKTSLNACRILENSIPQMKNKGRVQVGKDADLVIFDSTALRDTATYTKPTSLSTGMEYVLVNGKPIIEKGEMRLDVMAGRPIRREASL
ncbi:D-glutamate deacylase [Vibrio sp. 10N.286.49.C2]|uniref:amidohydrolase family protein n=1 Tax=unclassified Vibrio TaxID=2614977 RepID=UPI000C851D47|nr:MULTISPECIES: amidohydrolase family protein [unclassified Vibrio]PMH26434.1 D-glutamate deacylase [Vibrio sp. 10N.286.49.C2]PMH54842.1 D-glutamate deacylase [Vibrio sp. 10N.286.49.B1]PMH82098.1 D-glutamate deacylase [Vibrio sp. 10N.286.48.B7]